MAKTSRPPATALRLGLAFVALLGVGACTTVPRENPDGEQPVRKVRHDGSPEQERLAHRAREFGNEWYPQLCALLLDETATPPRQFDVVLERIKSGNLGLANIRRRRIHLNASSFTNQTDSFDYFDKVFAHEMAHLAAQYAHWSLPFWDSRLPAEKYWGESIADYARFRLLGTNGWAGPESDSRYPHYTDGYGCGGAFLLFIEAGHGTNVVRELVRELRQKSYADSFFDRVTGKPLDQLWSEFQSTPAFRPGAVEAQKIREAIGYQNGRPPKDVVARFRRYVEQQTNSAGPPAFQHQFDPKNSPPIEFLIQAHVYATQPGGPAEIAVKALSVRGALPGFSESDKGHALASGSFDDLEIQNFPKAKTVKVRKEGDDLVYLYRMVSPALEQGWKLEAATRTTADGRVIEEFPVN